jgi:hypothetical protein
MMLVRPLKWYCRDRRAVAYDFGDDATFVQGVC